MLILWTPNSSNFIVQTFETKETSETSETSETNGTNKTSQTSEIPIIPVKKIINNTTNILDGCYHVYLDVGSNVGIQASLF